MPGVWQMMLLLVVIEFVLIALDVMDVELILLVVNPVIFADSAVKLFVMSIEDVVIEVVLLIVFVSSCSTDCVLMISLVMSCPEILTSPCMSRVYWGVWLLIPMNELGATNKEELLLVKKLYIPVVENICPLFEFME